MADGIRDKLIAIKQAWAQSRRLITGAPDPDRAARLPPGQRLVTNWPVLPSITDTPPSAASSKRRKRSVTTAAAN